MGTGFKRHFSAALSGLGAPLHFAAHSHHPWPDVTRAAQLAYWDDSNRLLDRKWTYIFEKVVPKAQAHVARILGLPDPTTLVFGQNTHEFLLRLLSALPAATRDRPLRVLTTDAEFHSFRRQMARLEEDGLVSVTRVAAEPFETFPARFAETATDPPGGKAWDLVYVSHVFFDSGYVVPDLEALIDCVPHPETFVAIDGYHSFMAMPVDFSAVAPRAFYLSGGYKYAMAGEGCCFMHCPPGYGPRPRDTGWYAAFGSLASGTAGVPYARDGGRFMGATFDPSGLYRLNAVMDWLGAIGLGVGEATRYVRGLQCRFASALPERGAVSRGTLLFDPAREACGRFLTFRTEDARHVHEALMADNVFTDYRGDRLRFGFGIYQDPHDVDALVGRVAAAVDQVSRL